MSGHGDDFVMVSENKVVLSCTKEKEISTMGAYTAYVALNLIGPAIEDNQNEKRSKLAITAVLDRSGSMAGKKLMLTKSAMHFITEQLQQDDYFGIVTYDHNVTTEFELTKAETENQVLFDKKIDSILTGGSTNLSGGLLRGIEQQTVARIRNLLNESTIRAVLLCTDGLANQGITDSKKLANITRNQISDEKNLRVHTFGFGGDHDPKMMKEMAEAGQGDFFYVESAEAIPQAFGNVLGGLLSVGAQNVTVVITPIDPSFRVVKVWDKVINQSQSDTGSTIITIRDLMSEIERKLLFEYWVGETDKEGIHDLAKIDVHYFNVATETNDNISCTLSIDRQIMVPLDAPTNTEVFSNIARVKTTSTIEQATATAENGDLFNAKAIIQRALQELKNLNLSDKMYEKSLCNDLQKLALGFQDEKSYQVKGGRHFANAVSHSKTHQAQFFWSMPTGRRQASCPYEGQAFPKAGRDASWGTIGGKSRYRQSLGRVGFKEPMKMLQNVYSEGFKEPMKMFENVYSEDIPPNSQSASLFKQPEISYSTKQQLAFQKKAADYMKNKSIE
eukprot:TRINITY_DN4181_c0_g1_i4.p1 TRINITY_DN4181_c0_g1~~TRINITY_DN4181_c0_g1_i4.p1  ORF type:complete len:561 (-),score=96.53 TRINITY_DN4181_c0_g1_i4:1763-3445(-)